MLDLGSRSRAADAARYFGQLTRSCRRARGLTQDELAERAGLSVDTIRRLEGSAFSPSLDTICKLCDGLELTLSTFFDALDLRERNVAREFTDLLDFLTSEEERALHQLFALLRERLR